MKSNDKIYIENRAEKPTLPCCVVQPSRCSSTLSFSPTHHHSALLIVAQPSTPLFSPPPHSWSLCVVVQPCVTPNACRQLPVSSLDLLHPCSTSCIVVGLCISVWGYSCHGGT